MHILLPYYPLTSFRKLQEERFNMTDIRLFQLCACTDEVLLNAALGKLRQTNISAEWEICTPVALPGASSTARCDWLLRQLSALLSELWADSRIWTEDLLFISVKLACLSRDRDSDPGPAVYKTAALPLSYLGKLSFTRSRTSRPNSIKLGEIVLGQNSCPSRLSSRRTQFVSVHWAKPAQHNFSKLNGIYKEAKPH